MEELVKVSFGRQVAKNGRNIDRKWRKFFHEREPRAGKRIDSAMRTIASPLEAIRDESPASMGAMG